MPKPSERAYYHLTFSPYKRIEALWDEIEKEFYSAAEEVAHRRGFSILAMAAVPDHVHVLVEKAPWDQLSDIVKLIKGVSSRHIGQRFPELKLDMSSNHFWATGYHYERHNDRTLDTVVRYIEDQKRKAGLED